MKLLSLTTRFCPAAAGMVLVLSGNTRAAPHAIRGESLQIGKMGAAVEFGPALTASTGSNWTVRPPEVLCGSVDGAGLDEMVTVERVSDVLAHVWIANGGDAAQRLDRNVIYPPEGVARLGDVNGDGRQDLVLFYRNGFGGEAIGDVMVCLARSDAQGFAPAVKWHDFFCINDEIPLVADFDGDGMADMATVYNGGDGFVFGAISSGTAFGPGTAWIISGIAPAGNQPAATDLNGDGLAELIVTSYTDPIRLYRVFQLSTGLAPALVEVPDAETSVTEPIAGARLIPADWNGDARGDLFLVPSLGRSTEETISGTPGTTSVFGRAGLGPYLSYNQIPAPAGVEPPVYYASGRLNDDLSDDLLSVVLIPASPPAFPRPVAHYFRRLSGDPDGTVSPWMDRLITDGSPHPQPGGLTGLGHFPPPSDGAGTSYSELRLRWLDQSGTWRDGPVIPRSIALTAVTGYLPPEAEIGYFAGLPGVVRITFSVVQNTGVSVRSLSGNVRAATVSDPYKVWAAAKGLTTAPYEYYADDDPDHDGLINGMEYLMDTDPKAHTTVEDGNPEVIGPADLFSLRCSRQPLYADVPVRVRVGYFPRFDFYLRYLPDRAARFPWALQDSTSLDAWSGTSFWTNTTWTSDGPWTDGPDAFRHEEASTSFYVAGVREFATDTGTRPRAFRRLKLRTSKDVIRSSF